MNASVRTVFGAFTVVSRLSDSKLEELVKLLELSDEDAAKLREGNGLVVVGPLADTKKP
ncbi:MAG: hypothetical protein J0H19_03705 [Rhodospirillales bacterium]|nr:hypothetical protein [Rhodospirillales bacterium]MBN8925707.1 hypothetical protein [Rhodospirillales bacterium]